ncbi:hypothetical protein AMELA_G00263190 [Ameiurus melas]|uniref:Uncharacterized protein n=1 Tax=Ameiurus melas TaxID=219545 RepID=A0A7J5ZP66_AMEME|nr:hypothetical protein AMELA_G00263190 [Ameiurus melas]
MKVTNTEPKFHSAVSTRRIFITDQVSWQHSSSGKNRRARGEVTGLLSLPLANRFHSRRCFPHASQEAFLNVR